MWRAGRQSTQAMMLAEMSRVHCRRDRPCFADYAAQPRTGASPACCSPSHAAEAHVSSPPTPGHTPQSAHSISLSMHLLRYPVQPPSGCQPPCCQPTVSLAQTPPTVHRQAWLDAEEAGCGCDCCPHPACPSGEAVSAGTSGSLALMWEAGWVVLESPPPQTLPH